MSGSVLTPVEVVVVGAGMVAHRFVESLLGRAEVPLHVTVIGDEGRRPYDRAGLGGLFRGATSDDLMLDSTVFDDFRVRLLADDRALRIDRGRCTVMTRSRRLVPYDTLVLATGSYAVKVAVEGDDLRGCFSYRTLEDAESLQDFIARRRRELGRPLRGAVIGEGVRAAEAVGALESVDVTAAVVPLPDAISMEGTPGVRLDRIDSDASGAVAALAFDDGSCVQADVVVTSAGDRPRDELARNSGIAVDRLGGVVIDDGCRTSDPHVLAIGEVASFEGRSVGLLAPGRVMADVAAIRLLGGDVVFPGFGALDVVHPAPSERAIVASPQAVPAAGTGRLDAAAAAPAHPAVIAIRAGARAGLLRPTADMLVESSP